MSPIVGSRGGNNCSEGFFEGYKGLKIPLLPESCTAHLGENKSKALLNRLNYLWVSAHQLLATLQSCDEQKQLEKKNLQEPAEEEENQQEKQTSTGCSKTKDLAQHFIIRFIKLLCSNNIEIPADVNDYICSSCNYLLIPGLTCSIKVKKCGPNSVQNKKLLLQSAKNDAVLARQTRMPNANYKKPTSSQKMRNAVVKKCEKCQYLMFSPGLRSKKSRKASKPLTKSTAGICQKNKKRLPNESTRAQGSNTVVQQRRSESLTVKSNTKLLLDAPTRKKKKKSKQLVLKYREVPCKIF